MNAANEIGETPLTRSVAVGNAAKTSTRLVEYLLSQGALVEKENPRTGLGTSVHRAARSGDVAALRILLNGDGRVALSLFDDLGLTPLAAAVMAGSLEAARLIVDAKAPLDARDEETLGDAPLSHAVRAHDVEMVRLLLSAGCDPLVRGWMQESPVDIARDEDDDHHTPATREIRKMLEERARARGS